MRKILSVFLSFAALVSCGGNRVSSASASAEAAEADLPPMTFNADSAYAYIARQVEFGPRVPNTDAHRLCGDWLSAELRRHGAEVTEQKADLTAFDGTVLHARNIFGRINPDARSRTLLLAHWDTRPWADEDPDPANRRKPGDGANDGASGVGVILEIARQLKETGSEAGVDILFVDAEDWGTEGMEESWALGARHFVANPVVKGYSPDAAILLDMVGGTEAVFCREYFSQRAAPALADKVWAAAAKLGYSDIFQNRMGGAVTDDHVQFIEAGIPAIDIIEYHPDGTGFNPRWHTLADNMEGIDRQTLKAAGDVIQLVINN